MATIDTLQINIETNAGQSTKSINALAKAVERLTATTPNVEELGFAFAKLVNAIGRVDTGNLKSGLAASNSTLKSLRQNAEKARESLDVIQTGTTSNTTTVTTENAVSQHTNNIRKSAAETKKLTRQTEKSATAFSKLGASIKRIMLYRAIRSVLSSITKAVREGVENIVEWSKQINDPKIINASKVIAKYNNEWLKVKNTIGAVIIPVLEGLFGEFQNITTAIVNAGNVLIEYFTLLNDNNATKFVGINPDYFAKVADEAKKANGQLQKFDELNNLTTNSGTAETNYNDMFKTYDTTKKINFTWGDIIDKLKTAAEVMTSIWAISQVTKWGGEVAKLFGVGGDAAMLSTLGGWVAAGAIAFTLFIDYILRDKTGQGLGGWANDILSGNTDFQKTINEWWDNNINFPGFWGAFTSPEDARKAERQAYNLASSVTGEIFKGVASKAYELLTPMGWYDMLVKKPLAALDELRNGFKKTKEDATVDLKSINSVWGWLGSTMVTMNPEVDTKEIFYFKDAIDSAKARWQELNGLKAQPPHIKTDTVTAFYDAIGYVIERWKVLMNSGDVDLNALLKLTTEIGLSVGEEDLPDFLTNPEKYAEKILAPVQGIQKDFKDSIFGSGNSLQDILNGQAGFLSKLKTRLQDFLDDFAQVGSNVTKAISGGGGGVTTPESLKRGAQKFLVQAFADGGYPTSGSLFLAGEGNGAELVGTIGGRTAVANNAEITTAIATACYNAMSQALSENGMNVTLQGDANQMFKVVQRQARQYRQTTGSYAF